MTHSYRTGFDEDNNCYEHTYITLDYAQPVTDLDSLISFFKHLDDTEENGILSIISYADNYTVDGITISGSDLADHLKTSDEDADFDPDDFGFCNDDIDVPWDL